MGWGTFEAVHEHRWQSSAGKESKEEQGNRFLTRVRLTMAMAIELLKLAVTCHTCCTALQSKMNACAGSTHDSKVVLQALTFRGAGSFCTRCGTADSLATRFQRCFASRPHHLWQWDTCRVSNCGIPSHLLWCSQEVAASSVLPPCHPSWRCVSPGTGWQGEHQHATAATGTGGWSPAHTGNTDQTSGQPFHAGSRSSPSCCTVTFVGRRSIDLEWLLFGSL